jgi:hypothetical protein
VIAIDAAGVLGDFLRVAVHYGWKPPYSTHKQAIDGSAPTSAPHASKASACSLCPPNWPPASLGCQHAPSG